MITKGIVSSFVDEYSVKVRLPRFDRANTSSIKVSNTDLREAVICTPPNCRPNLQLGDIVFVEIDDQNEDEAIILGQLYYQHASETLSDYILGELEVRNQASLPTKTTIGDVTSTELSYLKGVTQNIALEFKFIWERISRLEGALFPEDTASEEEEVKV